jgi:hypothetical protein
MKTNVFGFYEGKKYRQWRAAEGLSSLFCVFGIIVAGIDYESGYSSERTHDNCEENSNPMYRILILVFSIISVFLLFLRHYLKAEWYSMQTTKGPPKRKSLLSFKLLLELLVILIFPYPGLTGSFTYKQSLLSESSEARDNRISMCYTYSELLYFFIHFRIFFIIRTFLNYTPYQDKHARVHCEMNNTKANLRFSVKSMMQSHPLLMIVLSVFPSFFLFGSFLRIFERPFTDISGKNYNSIENAVWNGFITMSTIGYGELYPSTFPGRVVAVLCSMWGAYAFSIMVFTMQKALELNANQVRALTTIKLTRAAGKVICGFLSYILSRKKGLSGLEEWRILSKFLKRFRLNLRKIKSLKRKIGFKEMISKHKIHELSKRLKKINEKLIFLTTVK